MNKYAESMKHSKAIVTLAIGNNFLERWKSLCQLNWQQYADKHGYALVCIDTPLDNSERAQQRSPSWQKCLILSQEFAQQYERVVWIDSETHQPLFLNNSQYSNTIFARLKRKLSKSLGISFYVKIYEIVCNYSF